MMYRYSLLIRGQVKCSIFKSKPMFHYNVFNLRSEQNGNHKTTNEITRKQIAKLKNTTVLVG